MRKIAALYSGVSHENRSWNEPKYNKYISDIIYIPEMSNNSLDGFDVVLVPSRLHVSLMNRIQPLLERFAANGGIVVMFWPQAEETAAPNQKWEFRPTNYWWWLDPNETIGYVLRRPDHELFQYIQLEDCVWHYHGIFHPPEGADVLITLGDEGAILYVDKVSSNGTWIVTALDPEYHYGSYFMPATERFLDGFFPWLAEGKV